MIQAFEGELVRDLTVILRFTAVFLLFYLAFQVGKKIKESKLLSATMGFSTFLLLFGLSQFFLSIIVLYPDIEQDDIFYLLLNLAMMLGMIFFIVLTEIESTGYGLETSKKFKYPLSLFSLIGLALFFVISFISLSLMIFSIIIIIIPFIKATNDFMKKFEKLEIVKRSNPLPWFFAGLSLVGFSNFINSFSTDETFLYFIIINTCCIIFGALMMTRAWNRLPSLSELDWMGKMERLMVVHENSSLQMYNYEFQKEVEGLFESELASSAIGGVDMLLKEILSSESHTKEIVHGNKNVVFSYGIATVCILITNGSSEEYRYRLNLFHLAFERQHGSEKLNSWAGDVAIFEKTDDLILKHFLQ